MIIPREKFEEMVGEVLDSLPEEIQKKINNLAIFVEDFATAEQLGKQDIKGKYGLLGLYEGYVQSSKINVGAVLPDKITIFRMPICQSCNSEKDCKKQIENTVKHEIAHHFGSDEKGARKASK